MSNKIIVKKTYIPKVGAGADLIKALEKLAKVIEDHGYPKTEIWKPFEGPHNAVVTIQRWNSYSEFEDAMPKWVATPAIRAAVFEDVYPTNFDSYDTEFLYDMSQKN
tara:strand:- start:412 stop:732 length:321 start_codon:yes stop_codon:yes gene_type:complete